MVVFVVEVSQAPPQHLAAKYCICRPIFFLLGLTQRAQDQRWTLHTLVDLLHAKVGAPLITLKKPSTSIVHIPRTALPLLLPSCDYSELPSTITREEGPVSVNHSYTRYMTNCSVVLLVFWAYTCILRGPDVRNPVKKRLVDSGCITLLMGNFVAQRIMR